MRIMIKNLMKRKNLNFGELKLQKYLRINENKGKIWVVKLDNIDFSY